MFYLIRAAVNATESGAKDFIKFHEEELLRMDIDNKLLQGFKGAGKLKEPKVK